MIIYIFPGGLCCEMCRTADNIQTESQKSGSGSTLRASKNTVAAVCIDGFITIHITYSKMYQI